MNTTKRKFLLAAIYLMATVNIAKAQPGTLEMNSTGSNNSFNGPSILPVVVNFREDILNLTSGTTFKTYTPTLNLTYSFSNQQFTNSYNNIFTGMAFGGGNTASNTGTIQQSAVNPVYNGFGASLVQPPQNGMFVSSPTGTIVANYQMGGRGVGLDPEGTQGGIDQDTGNDDYSFGVAVFTNVEPLFDANLAKDGRYYYGDLVLNFNRPVKNPVVHVGGLGGSYAYTPIGGGSNQISYFSTEMELQNTGVTSTFMAGNENLLLVGNKILNGSATPNAGSFNDGSTLLGFQTYGAATGSVRINGTVSQLVYKIYVRGSVNSNFNFSKNQADIAGATRDPLNGDLFYVAVSLNKPTQQISGNVFIDRDGLSDNNINKSAGVDNPKTNIGGTLYANLLNSSGLVVASTLVSSDGSYLFDAVPIGTYSVQLTTNSSAGTYATPAVAPATVLPTGWANTGEFVGNTAGSDGTVNGRSSSVVVSSSDIKTEVNFGIERLPESVNFTILIPNPPINTVVTFDASSPYFLTPLAGSDPEDLPATATLTGRTLKIDSLPSNSQLLYNGIPVTLGQIITNYNVSLFQIKFTQAIPSNGKTAFKYSFIDAAGFADPTPATYTIIPNNGPLFISLSEFTVSKNNCFANLNWKTSSEINSEKFEVEVSTDANATFTATGTIAASTNSTISKNYQFNFSMETGVQYYFRLKMINRDGSFTYSEIRKVSCNEVKTQIAIAPNPVVDIFKISGMEKGKNTISIYSNDGKLIKSQVISTTTYSVDMSNFSGGLYMVRIVNENGSNTINRIVKK